jgi:hypothetical protein
MVIVMTHAIDTARATRATNGTEAANITAVARFNGPRRPQKENRLGGPRNPLIRLDSDKEIKEPRGCFL